KRIEPPASGRPWNVTCPSTGPLRVSPMPGLSEIRRNNTGTATIAAPNQNLSLLMDFCSHTTVGWEEIAWWAFLGVSLNTITKNVSDQWLWTNNSMDPGTDECGGVFQLSIPAW